MTESKSDPLYADLMTPANGDLPLHNYYSEFRLGQGDPLMKAAMKQWPCTTTEDEDPPVANKTETPKPDNGKRCNVVGFPAPSAVAAPLQTPSTLLCNTVGQE